jgi:predicted component of viral defense system (DUF524 family)
MPAVSEVRVPVRSTDGLTCGYLRIALLPRGELLGPPPLLDTSRDEGDAALAPIQLLEGFEYRYEWEQLPNAPIKVSVDPEEIFQPDTIDGRTGRLRPGLSTGTLQIAVRNGELTLGQLELEVRSRKLSYLSEYRWMLRDIADQMTELVMDRFAVSDARFVQDDTRDAVTLYQRFAFLRALITSESFSAALGEITRNPHVAWEERQETVALGSSVKASSYTVRQLSRGGARAPWPGGVLESLPVRLDRHRTDATYDTTPNRFVRFALERWHQVVADIDRVLASIPLNAAISRGRREIAQTLEKLDAILHHDLFKDLGPLNRFPADNQVLQRREGYRDIFRAYLEFELAARLSWPGTASNYSAGQRDVATLYEYWAFIQLAQLVAGLVGKSFDLEPLVVTRGDALNVVLQAGKETVLSGVVDRRGRRMAIELCFNRTFRRSDFIAGSWTRPMRPDYSLIISAPSTELASFEPVVLHFDAKYRVNFIDELLGGDQELANAGDSSGIAGGMTRSGVLRTDLLKMHAYRDAIRRSAGAYVLYPGDDVAHNNVNHSEYHELLPGLGAFVLRPTESGEASGGTTLRSFLDQVLDHVATRLTRHERGRYWLEQSYSSYDLATPSSRALTAGSPGPKTTVLLGYVKNVAHWDWIRRSKVYNIRTKGRVGGMSGDSNLLYSQLLLLYSPDTETVALARIISEPELVKRDAMKSTGYPDPSSDYWCVQLNWLPIPESIRMLSAAEIDVLVGTMGKLRGEPTAVTFGDLLKH